MAARLAGPSGIPRHGRRRASGRGRQLAFAGKLSPGSTTKRSTCVRASAAFAALGHVRETPIFVDPKVNVKISKGSGPENTKGARVGYVSRVSEAGDGPAISDVKERAWEPIFGTVGGAPNE